MSEQNNKTTPKQYFLFGVIIFIIAAAGVYFGSSMKTSMQDNPDDEEKPDIFTSLKLFPDSTFPDVALLDKDSHPVGSQSLISDKGTLILFIDSECSSCHTLAKYWQQLINEGKIDNTQVCAISYNDIGYLMDFLEEYGITFDIYTDTGFTFLDRYGIDAYPFELVVNENGIVTYTNSDSRKKLSVKDLNSYLNIQ